MPLPPIRESIARALLRARTCAAFGTLAALALATASARDLATIDRLGEAAPRAAAASPAVLMPQRAGAPVASLHLHSRLGVPTFLWGGSGAQAFAGSAAAPSAPADPVAAARGFLRDLGALYALPAGRIDPLPVLYTQRLPNGAAIVKFRNRISEVEVFREEAAVLLGADRQLVAIGGYVMGGEVTGDNGTAPFASGPSAAIAAALADWAFAASTAALLQPGGTQGDYRYFDLPAGTRSADGSRLAAPVRAKPVLFRLPEQLIPAWYIEVQVRDGTQPGTADSYAYVVAAADLSILYRNNQSADAAFTYRAFAEAGGSHLPLPSPSGRNGFPYPDATPDGYQGPFVSPNLVTLQNLPFSRNDPWLPAGATVTTGNNVDAYADLGAPDGFSPGDVRAALSAAATFDHTYDTAQAPNASPAQIQAAVTNLFYVNNWLHDWYYDAGFDEAAGNAQADNFGRGGIGGDALLAEAQDNKGRNNANITTPADGAPPRMQMFVFDGITGYQTTITAPPAIAGVKKNGIAFFGPQVFNLSAPVAYAAPADGCATVSGSVAGKIALVDRGGACSYKAKVANAQTAGALGFILANNAPGLFSMSDDPAVTTPVVIPATVLTQADADALKARLATGVTAQLQAVPGVDRDGTIDNTIIAHEWGHYISNRLVADANGLSTQQSRGLGEGWADFHALLLLVKAEDGALPWNAGFGGSYAIGAYTMGSPPDPLNDTYYYGFRRYPYSRDMTKNPLTLKHMTNGVALPLSPAPAFGASGTSNAEVHSTGEVWTSLLWECYSNLLDDSPRLTFAQAQDRMKRYLVAAYKLTPADPTLIEARDALLATMFAQDGQDYVRCFQGFAKRGAGLGAVAPERYSTSNAGAAESFSEGGALAVVAMTIADVPGYCDVDGILDNSETGTLQVTLQNFGTVPLASTTGSVSASNPHVTFPAGTTLGIPPSSPGQTFALTLPVHLAGASGVESTGFTVTLDDPALVIARPVVASTLFWINADAKANQSATDHVETVHTAWTTGTTAANAALARPWQRTAVTGIDHRWLGPDPGSGQLTWLQSPPLNVAATGNFTFTFRHRFSFEADAFFDYDGGQIHITTNDGATWTDIGAAATPGYNGTLADYQPNANPLVGQPAYVKKSPAYPALETVTVNLGTAYAGQTVRVRFAIGSDEANGAAYPGWEIDDIAFANITNTPFDALLPHAGACYSVTAKAGAGQWTLPGTPFATALKALVKDPAGVPVPGVAVTFALPGSGATAIPGGALTVNTDAGGIATAPALTANATAGTYYASATTGAQSAAFGLINAPAAPLIDIDANNEYDALTDGLLLLRYMLGQTGSALTIGATGGGAARTDPTLVLQFLDGLRPLLDIDGDGRVDPFTDGLLLIRYLFGLRGAPLIAGAVAAGAPRDTAALIEPVIQALLPALLP